MVRRGARLDTDHTRRELGKERQHPPLLQLLADDYAARGIDDAVDLENRLRDVETSSLSRCFSWLPAKPMPKIVKLLNGTCRHFQPFTRLTGRDSNGLRMIELHLTRVAKKIAAEKSGDASLFELVDAFRFETRWVRGRVQKSVDTDGLALQGLNGRMCEWWSCSFSDGDKP
jgi:hypothetical protein